jgi:branched-chain amino acid transport system permease protein
LLQFILSGLALGAIYGLIGMALAISYYVTRVINFAEGQLMMLAIMVTATLASAGYAPWLAIVIGLGCSCVVSVVCYFVAVRPILLFDRFSFGWLVSTLGFALVLENATAYIFGPESRPFPPLLDNVSVHLAGAVLTAQEILAVFVAAVLGLTFEVLRRQTLFGKLGMATAADPEMASAIGVNTTTVAVVTFILAGLFAGVAGILVAPRTFANPYLGDAYGTAGFVALMIGGGTERPIAAMFGGFLLGLLSEGANALINSQASDWFPFVVLVVILIVTPRGLLSSSNPLLRGRRAKVA